MGSDMQLLGNTMRRPSPSWTAGCLPSARRSSRWQIRSGPSCVQRESSRTRLGPPTRNFAKWQSQRHSCRHRHQLCWQPHRRRQSWPRWASVQGCRGRWSGSWIAGPRPGAPGMWRPRSWCTTSCSREGSIRRSFARSSASQVWHPLWPSLTRAVLLPRLQAAPSPRVRARRRLPPPLPPLSARPSHRLLPTGALPRPPMRRWQHCRPTACRPGPALLLPWAPTLLWRPMLLRHRWLPMSRPLHQVPVQSSQ
mmetsp:Transcript_71721/g.233161  ORF Transcript_71721/g.233161 Transcript_71721/m.233161 type:complete len:252 (-) Transcript_71721:1719-2474(-)